MGMGILGRAFAGGVANAAAGLSKAVDTHIEMTWREKLEAARAAREEHMAQLRMAHDTEMQGTRIKADDDREGRRQTFETTKQQQGFDHAAEMARIREEADAKRHSASMGMQGRQLALAESAAAQREAEKGAEIVGYVKSYEGDSRQPIFASEWYGMTPAKRKELVAGGAVTLLSQEALDQAAIEKALKASREERKLDREERTALLSANRAVLADMDASPEEKATARKNISLLGGAGPPAPGGLLRGHVPAEKGAVPPPDKKARRPLGEVLGGKKAPAAPVEATSEPQPTTQPPPPAEPGKAPGGTPLLQKMRDEAPEPEGTDPVRWLLGVAQRAASNLASAAEIDRALIELDKRQGEMPKEEYRAARRALLAGKA